MANEVMGHFESKKNKQPIHGFIHNESGKLASSLYFSCIKKLKKAQKLWKSFFYNILLKPCFSFLLAGMV